MRNIIMTVTLSIFLIPYGIFLLGWLVFFLIAIYHMIKFGFLKMATFIFTVFFISVAAMILIYSGNIISAIDWQTKMTIFDSSGSSLLY